jgi:hypothetical protein
VLPGHSRRPAIALCVPCLSLAIAGCGAVARSVHRPSAAAGLAPPCSQRARGVLAATATVAAGAIAGSPFTATNGAASCRFTTRRAATGPLDVIAELDGAPQAYYRLEKEVVEYGQNVIWGHLGNRAYPVTVPHLGLDADWFPRDARLATSDGVRLITIVVASSPAHAGGGELIAEKLARVYLRAAS